VGAALAINSGFFLAAAALVFLLPETKSTNLASVRSAGSGSNPAA
jgi:hypothetical protein